MTLRYWLRRERKSASPATKPERRPGQVRALGKRVEGDDICEAAGLGGDFQNASGRALGINLRVALVGEEHEVVLPGEQQSPGRDRRGSRRRLGGSRASKDRRRAYARAALVGFEPIEIGEKAGLNRRGKENRLGAVRQRGRDIDLIKRVGDQHGRTRVGRAPVEGGGDGGEQSLARAAEDVDVLLRIDPAVQPVAALEPLGDRLSQLRNAVDRRIFSEPFFFSSRMRTTKSGGACRGSPIVMSIAGAPGSMPSSSVLSRGNGD